MGEPRRCSAPEVPRSIYTTSHPLLRAGKDSKSLALLITATPGNTNDAMRTGVEPAFKSVEYVCRRDSIAPGDPIRQ